MPAANTKLDVFKLYDTEYLDNGCWLWLGAYGGRTRTLRPYFQHGNKRQIAYRVVYELVHGVTLTSDQLIRHSCDNGGHPIGCGNPEHLSLGTNSQNMSDMKLRERHGLPHHVVRHIRRLLENGELTHDEIAGLYGTSASTISAIATGRVYAHVGDGSSVNTDDSTSE
jgi:hypothetical protein